MASRNDKQIGVIALIALDDFGTRIASAAHLQRLRPDRVKIDGALVRHALGSAQFGSALQTIVFDRGNDMHRMRREARRIRGCRVQAARAWRGLYPRQLATRSPADAEALLEPLLHQEQRELEALYGDSEA